MEQHAGRLRIAAGLVLVGVLGAVVIGVSRPRVDPVSEMGYLLIDRLGAVAVVDAQIASVERLDGVEDLLTLTDVEVRWRAEQIRLVDGKLYEVPPIPEGDDLQVAAWAHHEYAPGDRYHLFLIPPPFTIEEPVSRWRSQFALRDDDQRAVEGVEQRTIEEMRAILAPGEFPSTDTFPALLELTKEQFGVIQARNAGDPMPWPGPRTARLETFRRSS